MSGSKSREDGAPGEVTMHWAVKIPLRDGVRLNATLYLPRDRATPAPVIFTLTPYVSQYFHSIAVHFAAHGHPFLTVDVRGRGNSEGEFWPFVNEAEDAFDIVEWLARQPYCNGKVAMWGGSYGGYVQWAAARALPPHLATIVPVAAPYGGVDIPSRNNIAATYWMRWLTLVAGRTAQFEIFADDEFWNRQFRAWYEAGVPYIELDSFLNHPSPVFQAWAAHPCQDAYWDRINPSAEQYARLSLPILTITGAYDGDQPGALMHYRQHMKHGTDEARARHYLVIGPWDHAGTRDPKPVVAGLALGEQSLVDVKKLHREWYEWIMQSGPKPPFLRKNVAYYVTGLEQWRYADTLDAVTARMQAFYLDSNGNASTVFSAGYLKDEPGTGAADSYIYDPRDLSAGVREGESRTPCCMRPVYPTDDVTDQSPLYLNEGKQLVYHSAPFEHDLEIAGFFKFHAWLAIDQPDTDFSVTVYDIGSDGRGVFLAWDSMRARYRESLREERLIRTREPLLYAFENFTFVARRVAAGHRLRLVIGPLNTIHHEKNYNSGGVVARESMRDARAVTVRLFHDARHPSVLHVPVGSESDHV